MEQLLKDNILTFEPFIDQNATRPQPPPPPPTTTATSASSATSSSISNPATADELSASTADGSGSKTVIENREDKGDVVNDDEDNISDQITAASTPVNDSKSSQIQSMEQELEILTFEEFCDALSCSDSDSTIDSRSPPSMWCVAEDEILSLLVNGLSDKLGLDPLMVSSSILEGHRVSRGLLPHRTANQIQARYAALCVLNKVPTIFTIYHYHLVLNNFFFD